AVGAIHRQVDALARATADDPGQRKLLPDVRERVDAKLAELDETIRLRRTAGFDAARTVVLTDRGKNEMDALRDVVGPMTPHEQDARDARLAEAERARRAAVATGLVSGLVTLAAFAGFLLVLRWDWPPGRRRRRPSRSRASACARRSPASATPSS